MRRRFQGHHSSGAFGARGCIVLLACIGIALTLGVAGSSASSAPSFASPKQYATGYFPWSVTVGDLNSDGKPDVATANRGEQNVSVLLNKGDGSFQPKRDFGTGRSPVRVAIGDLNNDGKPDLVTANSAGSTASAKNTVSVLLNRGDGTFQPKLDYVTGRRPWSIAIGDLNGDGKPDLVTANAKQAIPNPNRGSVSVLLNRGDGSFGAKLDYRTGLFPISVAIGDLNGDGAPDLATADANAMKISVLLNRGDGSFQARRDYATGRGPWSIAIGDLNGDGRSDLTTANHWGDRISVLLNRGDGSFPAKRDYEAEISPDSIAIGDVNGDGEADLLVPGAGLSVAMLMNRGDGRFQPKVGYPISRTPHGEYSGDPVSVATGDLNGDGKPDAVTANITANSISVLINTPGLCAVQDVVDEPLTTAKRAITRARCRVGKITRAHSDGPAKGDVISEKPKFGVVVPIGSRVNVVISRGPKR